MSFAEDILPASDLSIETAVAGDYFHGGHWGQCLELVAHLCQYGDSIILVTGPAGIGKTSLKQALLAESADRFKFCEIQASVDLTSDEMRSEIDQEFNLANNHNHNLTNPEQVLVLLIDDAENLDSNVISTLLRIKNTNILPRRLHIVLFADSAFEAQIARSPLKDKFAELVHTIELEPLTIAEMEAFLGYLQQQEDMDGLQFDKALIKKIYATTNGIPGKVRQFARALLTGQDVKKITMNTRRLSPFSVGLTVSFGLLFCLLAFLWPTSEPESTKQAEIQTVPDISADLQPEFNAANLAVSGDTLNPPDVSAIVPIATVPDDPSAQPDVPGSLDLTAVSADPNTAHIPATNVAQQENDNYAEQIARLETKLLSLQQQVEHEQEARQIAEQKVADVLHKARKEQGKVVTASKKVANAGKKNKAGTVSTYHDEKFLLHLPGSNYTLQLVASSRESQVKDFIRQHKLSDKARYFRTTYKGKPWFIVVYGNYSSRAEAVAALGQLPLQVKKAQPWPREISTVQRTIKKQ